MQNPTTLCRPWSRCTNSKQSLPCEITATEIEKLIFFSQILVFVHYFNQLEKIIQHLGFTKTVNKATQKTYSGKITQRLPKFPVSCFWIQTFPCVILPAWGWVLKDGVGGCHAKHEKERHCGELLQNYSYPNQSTQLLYTSLHKELWWQSEVKCIEKQQVPGDGERWKKNLDGILTKSKATEACS